MIAGLEKPNLGQIIIDGTVVSTEKFIVPPEKRKIGLVVQEKALFPHLSVYDNIGFGIKKNIDTVLLAEFFLIRNIKIVNAPNETRNI